MSLPVFIGGTGRSGTNILRKLLASSHTVESPSFETRYTVDPDGFLPFIRAFERPVTSFEADAIIKRHLKFLKRLSKRSPVLSMLNKAIYSLPGNASGKLLTGYAYAAWDLEAHAPGYMERLDLYAEWFEKRSYSAVRPGLPAFQHRSRLYFAGTSDYSELIELAASFIGGNIVSSCKARGAATYVEDNTFNLVYATTLKAVLPQAKFVHVRRHPMDVVASYCKQRWCPSDPILAAKIVVQLLDYIESEISKLPQNSVLEIALEDLLEYPDDGVDQLCQFLELKTRLDKSLLRSDKANMGRADKEFGCEQLADISHVLENAIRKYEAFRVSGD